MSNLFREIHKNSWLKRINTDQKKLPVTKKAEKFWVVFCVHDDFEALLEGYQEPRFAPLHQPDWTLSLQTTQHISHALVPTESDYEFVITLSSTVARFTAPSWEAMQEWVSTIRSKLREMKIISPKENLYSRLPEIRQPLLPTRDPMSPLPAPPPVPAAIVPGIEPAVPHNGTTPTVIISTASQVSQEPTTENEVTLSTSSSQSSSTTPSIAPAPAQMTSVCAAMSNTLTQNLLNMLSDPIANLTHRLQQESLLDRPSTSTDTPRSAADSDASTSSSASSSLARTFTTNVLNNEKPPPPSHRKGIQRGESTGSSSSSDSFKSLGESITPLVIPRPQTSKQNVDQVGGGDESSLETPSAMTSGDNNDSANGNQGPTNITIIQVSDPVAEGSIGGGGQSKHLQDKKTFMANIEVNCEAESPPHHSQTQTVRVTSPKLFASAASSTASSSPYDEIRNLETGVTNISVGAILIQSPVANNNNIPAAASHTQGTGNYEQVFIGDRNNNNNHQNNTPSNVQPLPTPYSVFLLSRQQRSASHVELTTPQRNLVQVNNNGPVTAIVNGGSSGRPPGGNNNNNSSLIEATQEATPESMTSSSSNSSRPRKKTNASENSARNGVESSVARVSAAAISPNRNSRQRRGDHAVPVAARKRSSSTSGDQRSGGASGPQLPNVINVGGRQRIVSPPRGAGPTAAPGENHNSARPTGRISLREQQVVQLRREIVHPGGVRLQLRRKDCVGSIALVDAFSSVWIAGWKQNEHPMLYNALHIGDRLVSVAGIAVTPSTNAAEVNKIIRNCQSAYIELIVRRVPFGRVYAIRRELDGQCLGLIRDSNTATIVDIIPNGLAARHGLPVKAKTCDGLSLTFWVLTEINGRPLNMFYKDNEVHDRLNAVGRDISILVQPLDLMAKLKKQLKGMRGYKDFIVQ